MSCMSCVECGVVSCECANRKVREIASIRHIVLASIFVVCALRFIESLDRLESLMAYYSRSVHG